MVDTAIVLLAAVLGAGADQPPGPAGPVIHTTLPYPDYSAPTNLTSVPGEVPDLPNVLVAPDEGEFVPRRVQDLFYDAPPGWFFNVDVGLVQPWLIDCPKASVTLGGQVTHLLRLPSADLDFTASPRFQLGYRLDKGSEFRVDYHFLASEGSASLLDFDPASIGMLTSRLDLHVVDLDYVSPPHFFWETWDFQWTAGPRLASLHFETEANGAILHQQVENDFFGAGPSAGAALTRRFGRWPDWALFGRVEGAALFGEVKQDFEEAVTFREAGVVAGQTRLRDAQVVPVLTVQTGLSWTPVCNDPWLRLSLAYEFEYWWNVGKADASWGDLATDGLYLRCGFTY